MAQSSEAMRYQRKVAQWLHPLAAVLWWDARRFVARPANFVIVAGTFTLMLWLFTTVLAKAQFIVGGQQTGHVVVSVVPFAAIGITLTVFTYIMEFIGLYLPFVHAEAVSGDLRRRTYALLMATGLPSWAYIWGRFLFGLLLSFGMAMLALVAYLLVSLTTDKSLSALDLRGLLIVWALNLLCPIVFLSGLGFALGTMLPNYANLVKVLLLLGWLTIFIILRNFESHSWEAWDPTSASWVDLHVSPLIDQASVHGVVALNAQARVMPDVSMLVVSHGILAVIGLGATLFAALSFNRFRGVRV